MGHLRIAGLKCGRKMLLRKHRKYIQEIIFQKNIYHDRGWTWKRQTGHLHKSNGRNGNNTKANMAI